MEDDRATSVRRVPRALGPAVLLLGLVLPALASASLAPGSDPELRLAYLDPGTGSFLIQALVAAVAGIAVTMRLYWSKIKRLFGGAGAVEDDEHRPEDAEGS